jgi:pimeloyl-ACP methyl ester carboxylesterase
MSEARGLNRRSFVGTAGAALSALPLGFFGSAESANADAEAAQQTNGGPAIRPFRVNVPEVELVELRRRINTTRWPDPETVADDSQGVPQATMQQLARYWGTRYDWRTCETKLNALPQFVTEIDGLDIHFIHVRSRHEHALPVIVTHGWPGSILEQLKIIDPLTNPTAHGGTAADAFHVVIPSIPGFGFSGKPTTTGWDPARIARAWAVLMNRLGYQRYVAQGGDFGALISDVMGEQAPTGLLGIHTNLPGTVPAEIAQALRSGEPPPAALSDDERRAYLQLKGINPAHFAYAYVMSTRPQTLYGLSDSPIQLAAWLFDHGDGWAQPAATITSAVLGRTVNGYSAGAVTRDDVLDNFTLYWLTNTGISAGRGYWENKGRSVFGAFNVSIPVAMTVFPGELYQAPKSWAERAYRKLIYFNAVDKGGHFAAWEQPELFAQELRAGFRTLR